MAGTNVELQNPTYKEILQASRQQRPLYDSPQERQPIYEIPQVPNEKPAVSSLVLELVPCPPGFKLYESGGVRACGRST